MSTRPILAQRLAMVWFGCLVCLIVLVILTATGLLPTASYRMAPILGVPLFGLPALIGYLTGKAPARIGSFVRSRDPVMFWIATIFMSCMSIASAVAVFLMKDVSR